MLKEKNRNWTGMATLCLMLLLALSTESFAGASSVDPCTGYGTAILVDGSQNDLYLCRKNRSINNYSVAFGSNGLGKQKRGDNKTPVGSYRLGTPRKSVSGFHRFIPIKIPRRMGLYVGIHGPARAARWLGVLNVVSDWTAGCIAVSSDGAIEEIARFVKRHPGMKIHILPDSDSASAALESEKAALQTGDLIFQTSKTKIAATVIGGTGSMMTHVGMVVFRKGKPYVLEAVGPVKYTHLEQFVDRGMSNYFTVRRVKGGLTRAQKRRLTRSAHRFKGRPYDRRFRWDDSRIYCSELVFKAYERGLGMTLNDAEVIGDLYTSWNPFMHVYVSKVYGRRSPPKNEKIVTPQRLFDSPSLTTVIDTYPI